MWVASGAARKRGPRWRTTRALTITRREGEFSPRAKTAPRPRPKPAPLPGRPPANPRAPCAARLAARSTWPTKLRPSPERARPTLTRNSSSVPVTRPSRLSQSRATSPGALNSQRFGWQATAKPVARQTKFPFQTNRIHPDRRRCFYLALLFGPSFLFPAIFVVSSLLYPVVL
jgi:hypothetical protein